MANQRGPRSSWLTTWQAQIGQGIFWILLVTVAIAVAPDDSVRVLHTVIGGVFVAVGVAYGSVAALAFRRDRRAPMRVEASDGGSDGT